MAIAMMTPHGYEYWSTRGNHARRVLVVVAETDPDRITSQPMLVVEQHWAWTIWQGLAFNPQALITR